MKGYYFITDSGLSRAGNISDVKNALAAGVKLVQYREKHKTTRQMHLEALALRRICRKIIFIVNDRLDIALSAGADGVHLGIEDLPYPLARKLLAKNKIIGLSVHTLKQALEAERMGADYIGLGPIFATATKPDAGKPLGIKLIRKIKEEVSIPLIAIGGIDLANAADVVNAGADGLCAVSAVVSRPDPGAQIRRFQKLFRKNT